MKKEARSINTFDEFYNLMKRNKNMKSRILLLILRNKKIKKRQIDFLKNLLTKLQNIKKENGKYILFTRKKEKIKLNLNYEINELKKDLIYLEKGEGKLLNYLLKNSSIRERSKIIQELKDKKIRVFITDRDGTINNYCERYLSSIQSIYNAVFLINFISKSTQNSIILTSASLKDFLKVNIMPKQAVIFSGSKGREFLLRGKRRTFPLSKKQKKIFKRLKKEIKQFLSKHIYKKFLIIGSGFQEKYGQLTLARQDISNSINKKESGDFLKKIEEIVKKIDPCEEYFSIEDTGLDIEIISKLSPSEDFNKGKGIKYIIKNANINPQYALICGDTKSDLVLLKTARKLSKKTYAIFVTKDNQLKKEVKKILPDAKFVHNPDTLVIALYEISKLIK